MSECMGRRRIAVVGLGYVGLPVAVLFARHGFSVIGYDIDAVRVGQLRDGIDVTREIPPDRMAGTTVAFTDDEARLREADFYIVTVPTPVDDANQPDLRALRAASASVGAALKPGDIVVYESTVFPGATEEECVPILERSSGYRCGRHFTVGYSPERINPGDRAHTLESIRKIVSGQDARTTEVIAAVYGAVIAAGLHVAPSIKVAEAAKVIENAQRDINIAFMNELSEIFRRLDIDTQDVLAAAATKWNFLNFAPGLVGGHCIGVDPYYLTHRAERAGYHPQVILAGRRINDSVGQGIARQCVRMLLQRSGSIGPVTQLGLTFKEDVADLRNSKASTIVSELRTFGIEPDVIDPWASARDAERAYGITLRGLENARPADAVIVAVGHRQFAEEGWDLIVRLLRGGRGIVLDVKSILSRTGQPSGITLWRL